VDIVNDGAYVKGGSFGGYIEDRVVRLRAEAAGSQQSTGPGWCGRAGPARIPQRLGRIGEHLHNGGWWGRELEYLELISAVSSCAQNSRQ